jgi:hypothetical protein
MLLHQTRGHDLVQEQLMACSTERTASAARGRVTRCVWIASTVACLMWAIAPARIAAAAEAPKRTIVITGVVLDEAGRPAPGVELRTRVISEGASARTGPDGRFELKFEGSAKARLTHLHATTPDGASQTLHAIEGAQRDQPAYENQRLTLKPVRTLTATVEDAQGKPVEGAGVLAVANFWALSDAATNAAGEAAVRVPADAPMQYLMARKPGAGMDYFVFWRKDEPTKTDPFRLAHDHAAPVKFVLRGMTKVAVHVADGRGQPLAGVDVHPWYYEMPRKGDMLNLPVLPELRRETDARGVAEFEVPTNNTTKVTFWARLDGYFAPERCVWDPASAATEARTVLVPQVRVTGRVQDEQGRPAGGATVRVGGSGHQFDSFREQVETGPDGTFELDVDPDMFYVFAAGRAQTASAAERRVIRAGDKLDPVELKLAPATRLFGQVTAGDDEAPAGGAYVTLSLQDIEAYQNLPPGQQLPQPATGSLAAISPQVAWNTQVADDGAFEFWVGPGLYYIHTFRPQADGPGKIEVRPGQAAAEVNLHAEQAEPTLLEGQVVMRDAPDRPVPEVTLRGIHTGHGQIMRIEGASGPDGRFSLRVGVSELYLYGVSIDEKLRGVAVVPPGARTATLAVGPTATARGRLVDPDGKPLAGRTIKFGVKVAQGKIAFMYSFGGETTTGEDGTFTAAGLVPGFDYALNLELPDEGRRRGMSRTVKTVRADAAEEIDLGDVKGPAEESPGL